MKDIVAHGEGIMWSTAEGHKKIYGFDIYVVFE